MTRLKQLARGNKVRERLLLAREGRERKRGFRSIECVACGESEHTYRDPHDICDGCLIDLWGAQDILKGEYKVGKKAGLVPVWMTGVDHWLPYPALAQTSPDDSVPENAIFSRRDKKEERSRETSEDVMRKLYVEIISGLAGVLPCDPAGRADAEALFPGGSQHNDDAMFLRLPAKTVKGLRDLWDFFRWHSESVYLRGLEEGRNLIGQLATGGITAEALADDVADDAIRRREHMADITSGKRRYGSR